MKKLVLGVGLAAAGAFAWQTWGGQAFAARTAEIAPESLYSVQRGKLKIDVVETGYLKAKNSVNVSPEFQREATITWLIQEGKTVAEGEVLAEFDRTELENQVDDLEKQLLQSQNELASAHADLEIQGRDSEASIKAAEFNLRVSKLKLERHDKGDRPNEERKLNLAMEKSEADYGRAQERYRQIPELEREGFMTKVQAEQERVRLREAELQLESARREFELWRDYSEPMEREQLEVNVRDQERQLINAEEKAKISVREKETRVSRSESQVKQIEQRLDKLKKDLEKMTIKAPRAGIVHYGDPARPWEREEVKVGNRFYRGNTLFTLPDLREMQVLIQVHEADIDLVKLEQKVVITVDAVKDRTFTGKVTRIDAVADSDWNEGNKSFGCEITMDPIDVEMRAGISAKAEIQVEELPDVMFVPLHAVVTEDGTSFCFVSAGASWEKRTVKTSKNNMHYVVIEDGLTIGERVLLYDPRGGASAGQGDGASGDKASPSLPAAATGTP